MANDRMQVLKSQTVELYVPTGSSTLQTFDFKDIPQLRNKIVNYIEAFSVDDVPISPSGRALVSTAILTRTFFTMYVSDMDSEAVKKNQGLAPVNAPMGEKFQRIPLVRFRTVQTGTNPYFRQPLFFGGMRMDWSKSSLFLGSQIGTENVSYLFTVYYSDIGANQ